MHVHSFKSDVFIPAVVELEAILRAMQITLSFGWRNVCFEMDTLTVNQSIIKRDRSDIHWVAEYIYDDILTFLNSFVNIFFCLATKKANILVHIVGKWAANQGFSGLVNPLCLPPSFALYVTQDSVPEKLPEFGIHV